MTIDPDRPDRAEKKLPLLQARFVQTRLCTYCPKLCRPACPVSTVEGRETITPWGKMRAMDEIVRGVAPADEVHFAPVYACTGCLRCLELCELDNPVAAALGDGRVEALRNGAAPAVVRELITRFPAREAALVRVAEKLPQGQGTTALMPGCTAVTFEPENVLTLAGAMERMGPSCTLVADLCCGLPLLEAGDRDGFVLRARNMARRLKDFTLVVTPDAGCAFALRRLYPQVGVELPRVQHLAEFALDRLSSIPPLVRPPWPVAYHDPCRLGRGLGVYDPPRAVLGKLLGRAPIELPEHRAHALCSGAGGLLPRTRPRTAEAIARELALQLSETGATLLVTACAASRRQLQRVGVQTVDLAMLLARAFDPEVAPAVAASLDSRTP